MSTTETDQAQGPRMEPYLSFATPRPRFSSADAEPDDGLDARHIGEFIRQARGLSQKQIGQILAYQHANGLRFGEAAIALKLATSDDVLWALSQQGPEEQLNQTEFTQPALLAAGVAVWRAWIARGGAQPAQFAGHSLGEYAALVAAGALSLAEGARLVRERGRLMQAAVPVREDDTADTIEERLLDIAEKPSAPPPCPPPAYQAGYTVDPSASSGRSVASTGLCRPNTIASATSRPH